MKVVYFGDIPVECEFAQNHAVGLSQHESLEPGSGMLFEYPEEQSLTFWMPAYMKFPIDMVFVDSENMVTRVYEHCMPGSKFKYTGFGSRVVEVPSGFCRANNVKPYCAVSFDGVPTLTAGYVKTADPCSDRLRGITTAEVYKLRDEKLAEPVFDHVSMQDITAEEVGAPPAANSTETEPYTSRAPSKAPQSTDRFKDRQIPADYAPDAGPGHVQEPFRDESWNSPTRPF